MSTEDLPTEDEYGITEEDRREMAELAERSNEHGRHQRIAMHGLDDPEAVDTALDICPDEFTPAKVLPYAYLLENGSATVAEVAEATGISDNTVRAALTALAERDVTKAGVRETESRGRNPVVYSPQPWNAD